MPLAVMNQETPNTVPAMPIRTIAALAVALAMLPAARASADHEGSGEVWLISTRRAPRAARLDSGEKRIGYWRLDADHRWTPAGDEDFFDDRQGPVPTTVFIHGNRTGRNAAVSSGWRIYRLIRRDAAAQPFRFVIWSWPSDRIRGGNRKDLRVKACYSDVQGYYLARCLERVDPEVPVSLVGYSFGARAITAALHLLGGGRVAGWRLPQPTDSQPADGRRKPIRAVLVAAALDADWLMPGRRNGRAPAQVERMLVTRNGCDPVLKWYPWMYRRRGPQALGYGRPVGCTQSENIELLSVSCSVGKNHDWTSYLQSPGLRRRLAWYTFLDAAEPETTSPGPGFPEIPPQAE